MEPATEVPGKSNYIQVTPLPSAFVENDAEAGVHAMQLNSRSARTRILPGIESYRPRLEPRRLIAAIASLATIGSAFTGCGVNSAGKSINSSPPLIVAPSNLTYVTTTLLATVGVAITPDTGSVAGSGATFSVSPALPAGLVLAASTGTISGTPTQASSSASYIISAANSAGSTTATLTIAVAIASPSNLAYAIPAVNDTIGTPMQPDIPTVSGTVSGFSVDPALPTGLILDSSTGIISGIPTASSPATIYTITAENTSGSATTQLTLAVNGKETVLLEQGHGNPILAIRATATNVLSEDANGHWVLWDYASGGIVANGDGAETGNPNAIDLAGHLAVVATAQQLQVYSVTDGHPVLSVPLPSWWKLATDGSYLCAGTPTALTAWASSGDEVFSLSGDYHSGIAYAAPDRIQLADGPSGANVIETDSFPGGAISTSAQFSGTFYAWFLDGQHFFSNIGNSFWIYSNSVAQQALLTLPTTNNLTGQGNWFWTTSLGYPSDELDVYAIGSTSPAEALLFQEGSSYIASRDSIGILQHGSSAMSVVDLSGSAPQRLDFSIPPITYLNSFAAASASQWIVGNAHGVLVDGASLATARRYFGYGAVYDIVGSSNLAVVSTAIGKVLVFNPVTATQTEAIDFFAGQLAISTDGAVLAASGEALDEGFAPDRTLNLYSLPSSTPNQSFPYTYNDNSTPFLIDFSLSGSGTVLGQVLSLNPGETYSRSVTNIENGSAIWSDTGSNTPILLSPDGTLIATAAFGDLGASSYVTNIYLNGNLVGATAGTGQGWIDNGHMMVLNWADAREGPYYTGTSIVDPTGAVLSTIPLTTMPAIYGCSRSPQNECPQFPSPGRVYDPMTNSVYALPAGQLLWQITVPISQDTGIGTVVGSTVVFESGHQVVAAAMP